MGRNKSKSTVINNIDSVNLQIDYDELAQAIVKAQKEADAIAEKENQESLEKEYQEIVQQRKKYLKEKDFSHINCRFLRNIRTFLNQLRVFKRMLFIPKKEIKLFSAIDGLISSFTIGLLFIVRIILYVFALLFILSVFKGNHIAVSLLISFVTFSIAQLIRIAQYEVERLKDRDYVLALFVGILTIFSIIVSVLTLFPDSDILEIKQIITEIKSVLQTL